MIKVIFDKEKEVFVWKHIDRIYKEDVLSAIEETKKYVGALDQLKIIELNCDAEIMFNLVDISDLPAIISHFDQFGSVKHAFVGNIPKNVAFFTVAIDKLQSKRYKAQVFSLKKVAYDWLSE